MLGLSSVIACTTAKLIRVDAPHSLVPGLRRIRNPESSLRGCLRGGEDTEQGSRSDSDLYTLRFGIVPVSGNFFTYHSVSRRPGHDLMRARDLLFRQHVANHGAQRHRVHRLVQQMVTAGAGLPQQLWTGVATDEEGGNLGGKYPAQPLYNFHTGFSAGQMIVRDN